MPQKHYLPKISSEYPIYLLNNPQNQLKMKKASTDAINYMCTKNHNHTISGIDKAVFDIGIPILGTLIWVCPNLILSKTKTTVKQSSSFLIKSAT